MSHEEIGDILDSEREWRRYLIQKLDKMETQHDLLHSDIIQMKTWAKVWRLAWGGTFGLLLAYIQAKLSK
jgi:hypothetical protein